MGGGEGVRRLCYGRPREARLSVSLFLDLVSSRLLSVSPSPHCQASPAQPVMTLALINFTICLAQPLFPTLSSTSLPAEQEPTGYTSAARGPPPPPVPGLPSFCFRTSNFTTVADSDSDSKLSMKINKPVHPFGRADLRADFFYFYT